MTRPAAHLIRPVLLLLLACAAPAHAAAGRAWLDAREALRACLATADATARGACLEGAARALDAAEARGEGPVPTPAQRRRQEARAYGLRVPAPAPAPPEGSAAPRRGGGGLTTTVASAVQDAGGAWLMTTAEGAVWAQTDGAYVARPPRPGSALTVHPGALGSFFCLIDGRREVRCKRRS